MRLRGIISCILSAAACLQACGGMAGPESAANQETLLPVLHPDIPENPFVSCESVTLEAASTDGRNRKRWMDFQTGRTFKQSDKSAVVACEVIDAGVFLDGKGLRLTSPTGGKMTLTADDTSNWPTRLLTRFHTLEPSEMDAAKFAAIGTREEMNSFPLEDGPLQTVLSNSSLSPFQSDLITGAPMYIAFKTYDTTAGNNFGIIEVKSVSLVSGQERLVLNYKMGTSSWKSSFDCVEPVTIKDYKFHINGKPFRAEGSAGKSDYDLTAEFGGSIIRVYSMKKNYRTAQLLDGAYEAGLKVLFSMALPAYRDDPALYEDDGQRKTKVEEIASIVSAYKNHPAILCWNIGDEIDIGMTDNFKPVYSLIEDICLRVKEIDGNHPFTFDLAGVPGVVRISNIKKYCPDIDFIDIDVYYPSLDDLDVNLRKNGWDKPFFVGEFGPMHTSLRNKLILEQRVNTWGSLIQLSSEEMADYYVRCCDAIKKYKGCLGSASFLWGCQEHGEVLGWYSMFTKDGYRLASTEAMRNYWKGEDKPYSCPLIASWSTSIKLNGKNVTEQRNPAVDPSSQCTASVEAVSRNGNPLKYKWFIYADNTYDVSMGLALAQITKAAEAMADGTMNEDANADLFKDRTKVDVEFVAPATPGNYRLYVIAYDEITMTAATGCLNFQVTD